MHACIPLQAEGGVGVGAAVTVTGTAIHRYFWSATAPNTNERDGRQQRIAQQKSWAPTFSSRFVLIHSREPEIESASSDVRDKQL